MYEWNKETPLWCCACDCPNGPGHEQSHEHLSKLLEFTMTTPDEQLRDILEEDERRSIRNTLASVVPAGATRKTSAVRIDPYESEVQGWLRAGMKWSEAKTIIGDELALPMEVEGDTVKCRTAGSNKHDHLRVTVDGGVVREFKLIEQSS
tara:strand:+ start:218 stop:667 length:450 start_codon:yes stop_codon:yes gene_type:complete